MGGILYLDMNALTESDDELQTVLYSFPINAQNNILCNSRGIYMTLNHLIRDITKQTPKIASFFYNNNKVNVVFSSPEENKLLLLSLPEACANEQAILLINSQILRFLEFTYQTIGRCFSIESLRKEIDSFFARFFLRMLKVIENQVCFEEILPAATFLYLPKEAQLQIDDALTELEASDYREWVKAFRFVARNFTTVCCRMKILWIVSDFSL